MKSSFGKRGKMKLLGIDEAGRGSVIGPMVMCGFLIKDKNIKKLEKLNIKDSKALTARQRESLVELIKEVGEAVILKVISSKDIDKDNINLLELRTTVEIIKETLPSTLFLDVPTNPAGVRNYRKYLSYLLKKESLSVGKIYAENKADEKFIVVSAASILAKVKRDAIIEELKQKYGDFGSGYPSDKKTILFLKKLEEKGEILPIVRKKWKIKELYKGQQEQMSLNQSRDLSLE